MGKKDAEYEGFLRGLATAERIAKEVENDPNGGKVSVELAKVIRMRKATGITLTHTPKEMHAATETIKMYTIHTVFAMIALVLYEQYGFGGKRLVRLKQEFDIHAKALMEGSIDWLDVMEGLKSETGMELFIPKELMQQRITSA
ncbi:MAG: hypothetical protein Q4A32_03455 [Lachnospiraceae bacterium]|nr:hypothetical protein [Lachnospiraceae bacterium]